MQTNRAILDMPSRYRETLLYNIWRMGMNSIERGSKDYWTITPKRIEALRAAAGEAAGGRGRPRRRAGCGRVAATLRAAAAADAAASPRRSTTPFCTIPRCAIRAATSCPSDQPDFATATRFVNALLKNGITVLKATAAFKVAGKSYPAGSYVVKTAQAFRPIVRTCSSRRTIPTICYPGGPPIPPYDITGWTLAMQMGVQYDRILDGFDGPFAKLKGLQKPLPRSVTGPSNPAGYLISHRSNNSFTLVNRLLKANADVYWLKGAARPAAKIWAPAPSGCRPPPRRCRCCARARAIWACRCTPWPRRPPAMPSASRVRIGLYDHYGG